MIAAVLPAATARPDDRSRIEGPGDVLDRLMPDLPRDGGADGPTTPLPDELGDAAEAPADVAAGHGGASWWRRVDKPDLGATWVTKTAPTADGDGVYVLGGGWDDRTAFDVLVARIDLADGGIRWKRWIDGPASGWDLPTDLAVQPEGPVVSGGFDGVPQDVYDGRRGYDWGVLALDAETGGTRWRDLHDGPAAGSDAALGVAADAAGVAVYGLEAVDDAFDYDGRVRAYATDGTPIWSNRSDAIPVAIDRAPDGDALVAYDPGLARVILDRRDAATGDRLWRLDYDHEPGFGYVTYRDLAAGPDGRAYLLAVADAGDGLGNPGVLTLAVDPAGDVAWRTNHWTYGISTAQAIDVAPDGSRVVAIAEGASTMTTRDFLTFAMDADGGSIPWLRWFPGPDCRGLGEEPTGRNRRCTMDSTRWDTPVDVEVGPGGRVHVVGHGYVNGNAPRSDVTAVTYGLPNGSLLGLANWDTGPDHRDRALDASLTADGAHLVVGGWTDPPRRVVGTGDFDGLALGYRPRDCTAVGHVTSTVGAGPGHDCGGAVGG